MLSAKSSRRSAQILKLALLLSARRGTVWQVSVEQCGTLPSSVCIGQELRSSVWLDRCSQARICQFRRCKILNVKVWLDVCGMDRHCVDKSCSDGSGKAGSASFGGVMPSRVLCGGEWQCKAGTARPVAVWCSRDGWSKAGVARNSMGRQYWDGQGSARPGRQGWSGTSFA